MWIGDSIDSGKIKRISDLVMQLPTPLLLYKLIETGLLLNPGSNSNIVAHRLGRD